jgi:adenylate cyclase
MYRYMTQELAEQLLNSGDAKLGGDRKEVSVLFSDIRGYTSLTENMEAEDVVAMLNEYFESMVDAVFTYKGTLDKYIGDAIMAVFGSPLALDDHAWMAVQTALEMRHRLALFNQNRTDAEQIGIGIGINSDSVISGNIGSSKRMEFTAIGDGVNLGSRLEGATKLYGCDILISESTYLPCADRVWVRELDYIRVKGKTKPVSLYELLGLQSEPLSDKQKQVIELYHQGRDYYLKRRFTRAMTEFATILEEVDRTDRAASLYLKRCQHWLNYPPTDDDWEDGVWTLTEK